ncbi:MAG: tyrosine-protein phosphatase, partial [Clostridiales bacterium]|nr:tyrosine-protein phosphatase [Clostridiales bacterium]
LFVFRFSPFSSNGCEISHTPVPVAAEKNPPNVGIHIYGQKSFGKRDTVPVEDIYPYAKRWELDTILQEDKLCHLYEKMGYLKTGRVENIKDGMDLVYYEKDKKGSLLKSTLNTRALPIGGMRYIRSDAPLKLTQKEIEWLLDYNISTLVDLRSSQEVESKPCPLQNMSGFTYYHLSVTGGGDVPKSREHLHEIYQGMVDKQMNTIIETILNATSGVLYFCTAGKDRTGVVSAMLLRRLGSSDDVIVKDYMESKENLSDMLIEYVKDHPEVDIDIVMPREENIRSVLQMF